VRNENIKTSEAEQYNADEHFALAANETFSRVLRYVHVCSRTQVQPINRKLKKKNKAHFQSEVSRASNVYDSAWLVSTTTTTTKTTLRMAEQPQSTSRLY
jgi:hypothetical protein